MMDDVETKRRDIASLVNGLFRACVDLRELDGVSRFPGARERGALKLVYGAVGRNLYVDLSKFRNSTASYEGFYLKFARELHDVFSGKRSLAAIPEKNNYDALLKAWSRVGLSDVVRELEDYISALAPRDRRLSQLDAHGAVLPGAPRNYNEQLTVTHHYTCVTVHGPNSARTDTRIEAIAKVDGVHFYDFWHRVAAPAKSVFRVSDPRHKVELQEAVTSFRTEIRIELNEIFNTGEKIIIEYSVTATSEDSPIKPWYSIVVVNNPQNPVERRLEVKFNGSSGVTGYWTQDFDHIENRFPLTQSKVMEANFDVPIDMCFDWEPNHKYCVFWSFIPREG